jgi:hypothetical protein
MIIGRLIGFLLVLLAIVVLLRDLIAWHDTGTLAVMSGTQLWYTLDPDDYDVASAMLSDRAPLLWGTVVTGILSLPAFLTAALFGLILIYLFRNRARAAALRKRNR